MKQKISVLFLVILLSGWNQVMAQSFYPGQSQSKIKVEMSIPLKTYAFDLNNIVLLDSPFKENQKREEKWLRSLDDNLLLLGFRVNAGLNPNIGSTATVMGGWESLHVELRGHTMGHVLSALALMYASTNDDFYKNKGAFLIAELAKIQDKMGGYLSAFPPELINRAIDSNVWAPWYTLHKIMAGLVDQYLYAGNEQALQVALKMGDWSYTKLSELNQSQLNSMLIREHGGIAEPFYNLYALTGERKYINLAEMFYRGEWLDPLAGEQDNLKGNHANSFIPMIISEARGYELTGNEKQRKIAEFFWKNVVEHYTFAIGGNSNNEHFFTPGEISKNLERHSTESCNTYNMLKLTNHLYAWTGDSKYVDYYEQALYNHILASQDPEKGMVCYFMPHQPGGYKVYCTDNNSFWCCTGTGFENHAKYGEAIYFHDNNSLYINLFIPSVLNWEEKGVKVRQETDYPKSDKIRLIVEAANGKQFPIHVRYPSWAKSGATVSINGKKQPIKAKPGSYIELNQNWQAGDIIEVIYPMQLRLAPANDNHNVAAIAYGPVVLAGAMGTEGMNSPYVRDQWDVNFNIPENLVNTIFTDGKAVSQWVKPVSGGEPLTFEIVDQPGNNIKLIPYYQMHHQRYVLYWNLETKNN